MGVLECSFTQDLAWGETLLIEFRQHDLAKFSIYDMAVNIHKIIIGPYFVTDHRWLVRDEHPKDEHCLWSVDYFQCSSAWFEPMLRRPHFNALKGICISCRRNICLKIRRLKTQLIGLTIKSWTKLGHAPVTNNRAATYTTTLDSNTPRFLVRIVKTNQSNDYRIPPMTP